MIEEMPNKAGEDVLALLQIFSLLHYEGISEEFFCRAWHGLYHAGPSDWMILY